MQTLSASPPYTSATARTLARMRRMARAASVLPVVRTAAMQIVRDAGPRNAREQAYSIRSWLRDHIRFVRDPEGVELIQAPDNVLGAISRSGLAQGDCDDAATLAAALGLAVGLRARFVVLAFGPGRPYSHVYAELQAPTGGEWYEMDIFRDADGYRGAVTHAATFPV